MQFQKDRMHDIVVLWESVLNDDASMFLFCSSLFTPTRTLLQLLLSKSKLSYLLQTRAFLIAPRAKTAWRISSYKPSSPFYYVCWRKM